MCIHDGNRLWTHTLGHRHSCPATLWHFHSMVAMLSPSSLCFIPRPIQTTLSWDCPRGLQSLSFRHIKAFIQSSAPGWGTDSWAWLKALHDLLFSLSLLAVGSGLQFFLVLQHNKFHFCTVLCTCWHSYQECFTLDFWVAGFFLTFRPQGGLPDHPITITPFPPANVHHSTWFVSFKLLITLSIIHLFTFLILSIFPD